MKRPAKTTVTAGISLLLALGLTASIDFSRLQSYSQQVNHKEQQIQSLSSKYQTTQNELNREKAKEQASEENNRKLSKENSQLEQKLNKAEKQLQEAAEWHSFRATYYDDYDQSTGKNPGDPGFGITASGRPATANVTIAVDPSVIPLGSWVEIRFPNGETEKRRADDVGGAIVGRHIDIYVPNASGYGVTPVMIRMLKEA